MHLFILSPVDASFDGLPVYLAKVSADLFWFGWWVGFSYHMFTPPLWRSWYMHMWFVLFKKFMPNSLAFWWKLEDSVTFLRVPHFDLLGPIFFWRRLQKWMAKYISLEIPARSAKISLQPNLLGGLQSCCQVADIHLLIWWCFLWDFCPLFSILSWGLSEILGRTFLFSWSVSQEILSLPPVFIVSWWRSFQLAS